MKYYLAILLVLTGLPAFGQEIITPVLYAGESQVQCPGGVCPPQYGQQQYRAPVAQSAPQQSPESDHHAGIVKVFFGNAGGSGTLVCEESESTGYVVTAHHVIEGQAATGRVVWPSGEVTGARVVGSESGPDLAVLRVFLPKRYSVIPVAENNEYATAGDSVEICGYRATYQGRMCHFFAKCEGYQPRDSDKADQIVVAARTVSGDSGGPIIHNGKVVAVLWGFSGGVDGTPAKTHGACCVRIRTFLNRFRCCPRKQSPPKNPVTPGPVDDEAPEPPLKPIKRPEKDRVVDCQCDPKTGERLTIIEQKIDAFTASLEAGDFAPKPGKDGRDGKDAKPIDYDTLAREVAKRLPPSVASFDIRRKTK